MTLATRARMAASNVGGGTSFAVGSFTKQNTTGSQAVTGVGFTPKAILFWTNGAEAASGTWEAHISQVIGFTSGAAESYCVHGVSQDAEATSNTGRRIAAKALTFIVPGGTLVAECDLSTFDADGFTLDWTTNASNTFSQNANIMFLAIGGADVSAKVVNWTSPTATGNKAVTGVGFQPDVVLHGAVSGVQTVPTSAAYMGTAFGAMDSAGGQWTNFVDAEDGQATSDTWRYQRTDKCIATGTVLGGVRTEAAYVSMDADGFTTNFTTASAAADQHISLCLSGVSATVGNFAKSTSAAPASQAVTGVGFQPSAVLLTGVGAASATTVAAGANWGMGAGDGTNERAAAQTDSDGVATTQANSIWQNAKVRVIGSTSADGSTSAEADLTSLDADGFTLNWTTNGAVATEELFLALA